MEKIIKIPENFILGASSSAWQTEGWDGKNGRDNYMDLWYKAEPKLWYEGYGPAVATDFYHRYKEDASLMKQCGIEAYRTSIDWSRFITDYENATVDEDALAYYHRMIDSVIAEGVEPMICLEHYELPAELFEKYGGWGSKHVVECFVKYAKKAFEAFGSKVKYWFTFNEPIVIQTRVYLDALRWPYEQNTKTWVQWNYNKILANAKVVQLYHSMKLDGKISIILNPEMTYSRSSSAGDKKAAEMFDLYYNRLYMDPCMKGIFPKKLTDDLKKHDVMFDCTEEELALIRDNIIDFVGMNLYFPTRIKAPSHAWNPETPFHPECYYDKFHLPGSRMNTDRGWEIYPKIIYDMGLRIRQEYGNMEWMITESGMGVMNELRFMDAQGEIQDDYRIDFINQHLYWAMKALEDGSNCTGYLLWAFTDCVSPMNAFKNRYGLVSIDLEHDRNRSVKKSGHYFKQLTEKRELPIVETEGYK